MKLRYLLMTVVGLATLTACRNDGSVRPEDLDPTTSEGIEYAPQMYDSYPYEPYKQVDHNRVNMDNGYGGLNARMPVEGSIARGHANHGLPFGWEPYNMRSPEAHTAGYEASTAALRIPDSIPHSPEVLERGKVVYEIMCDHCHGAAGEGDGPISKAEKIIVPSYKTADRLALSPGQMFFSITYGKNAMGGHATQITAEDRWALVHYVYKLQGRVPGGLAAVADTTRR
jgi:mono/diheme cytochrome c family protein